MAINDFRLSETTTESEDAIEVVFKGYTVRFRLPDSRDLMLAEAAPDADAARQTLLQRCFLSAQRKRQNAPVDQLPAGVIERIEEEMLRRDAQANIQLQLECPSCRRGWSAIFDIVTYFWNELDAWAQRMLFEVHKLASTYGWREADILSMSATRRNLYLRMVQR